ncbi:MAG TPA: hypothetical protein VH912_09765 [Streptosporangiaceae bacterium]|jgi:hypothetical protein
MRVRAAGQLLRDIEPLAYPERCRRLALYGREHAGADELTELLRALGERGHYEHFVALAIAAAAADAAHIERAMRDENPEVAAHAVELAARLGLPAAAFEDVVRDAPMAVRHIVYRAIRRARLTTAAENLLDAVQARYGDGEAAALLPACGPGVVAERLAGLAHAVANWRALALRHPQTVLDHAERSLAELPRQLRPAWWTRYGPGIAAAAEHDPGRVITLLEQAWPSGPLPWALVKPVGLLLDAAPDRMLALVLAPPRHPALGQLVRQRAAMRRLARLPDAELGKVARAVRDQDHLLAGLLRQIAPARRPAVYDAAMEGVDESQVQLSETILDVLPAARRTAEARRMLGLRQVRDQPYRVLELSAYLPYDEAEPTLREQTRRSDGFERATGYRLLIACAGRARDPELVTRVLDSLDRLRNEQDPVRTAAVSALAEIPRGLFDEAQRPALDRIIDGTLGARDSSYQTTYALTRLITRIFEQGAIEGDHALVEFALRGLERLTGHQGTLYLGQLYRLLPRGREYELAARLDRYLEREARRDEYRLTFTLAAALGRRGHDVPELQRALARALTSRLDSRVRTAIGYWLGPSGPRGDRVARLVSDDPSVVVIPGVLEALARRRTDLLGVVLGRRAPTGRFLKEGARYVPAARRGWIRCWTPAQREAYLKLLRRAAGDASLPKAERARFVRLIAEVPGVPADRLDRYLGSPDDLLRRAALTASPWVARPQDVLADLLARASSADAHVATYAATRAARFVRPDDLSRALETVFVDGKVTARKEAVRLLAHHRVPGAIDRLAALWEQPDLHADIRVAVVSAARQLLTEPAAWTILGEAATGPRDAGLMAVGETPLNVAAGLRRRYAEVVVAASRSPDATVTATAIEALPDWAAWAPQTTARLAEVTGDLTATAHWSRAARALVTCACSGFGAAELRQVGADLAAAADVPDAGAERDRPAAQRQAAITAHIENAAARDRDAAQPVIALAAEVLPEFLGARLVASTLRWDHAGTAAELDALVARPVGGVLATAEIAEALAGSTERVDPEIVRPHAERLAARGDDAGGLFAVALVAGCGPRAGWPSSWRDLVRTLRPATSADVAYLARATHTAAE